MKDKHNDHEHHDHREKPKKEKHRRRHGGLILVLILIIVILILFLLLFNPFGWGGGPGFFGNKGNESGNNTGNDSSSTVSVVSDTSSEISDTVIIKVSKNKITIDGQECADENALKEMVIAIGTSKKYELCDDLAIKDTYDKVKAVLIELQDALGLEINYTTNN